MKKGRRGVFWWWFLATLFAAGLVGFFLLLRTDRISEKTTAVGRSDAQKVGPDAAKLADKITTPTATDAERASVVLTEEERFRLVEKDLIDFLAYLDKRDYIRHLIPEKKTQRVLRDILGRLAANPPVPAGEGIDTRYLTANLYYFFRVLHREDLRLLRAILLNEEETMEVHLDMVYRWLTLCPKCPSTLSTRPPQDVLYQYAGFFLNTIGGRGYLFRRSPEVRLLVSYYALLVLFEADRKGLNSYGVDVRPLVDPLIGEIAHYPEMQFSQEYLSRLKEIQKHYLERRQ